MTPKEQLHALIDRLSDEAAEDLLDYLDALYSEPETLTDDEMAFVRMGQDQIARGEYVTLDQLRPAAAEESV